MSVFMLGGNAGYALGPSLAAFSMARLGGHGSLVVLVLGVALAPLVYLYSNVAGGNVRAASTAAPAAPIAPRFTKLAIAALMLVMFFRAWASAATTAYSPLYFPRLAGFSVEQASLLSSVYLLSLALGGVLGGVLADRVGGRNVLVVALLAFAPTTFLMFWSRDVNAFWFAPLAGLAAGASWPPLLVMAQDVLPRHSGVASGLALGFAFAMGGIGVSATGYLAEPTALGLGVVIPLLAVLPFLAAIFALALPGRSAPDGTRVGTPAIAGSSR
jgi:MFS transporter, FSR family, fosmidomycin resistance protein